MATCQAFTLAVGADEVVTDSACDLAEVADRRERIDSEDLTLMHPLFRHVKPEVLVELEATGGISDAVVRKRKNSAQSIEECTLLKEFRVA
jgi:hypothetical protein